MTTKDIKSNFGKFVADTVKELTDKKKLKALNYKIA